MRVRHVLLELIKVAVGAENGAVRGIKVLVEAVCKGDGGLHVIRGLGKRACCGCNRLKLRRPSGGEIVRVYLSAAASLMIKKVDAEAGIDGCLIGIGRRAAYLGSS